MIVFFDGKTAFLLSVLTNLLKKDSHLLKKNLSWIRWKYSNCWSLGEKRRRGQQWFWVGGYIYDHTKQGSTHLIKMHIIIRNLFVKRCCHCCNWTWTTYFWIFLSCSNVYTKLYTVIYKSGCMSIFWDTFLRSLSLIRFVCQ